MISQSHTKDGISETKKEDLIQYAKKQEHMTDLIEVSESAVTIRANGKKQDATMIQPMSKKRSEWLYQPSGSKE